MCHYRSRLIHIERDAVLHIFLESGRGNLHAVMSDRKFQKNVVTVAISGGLPRQARFSLPCGNGSATDDCAAWICNGSADVSSDLLSRQTEASQHYKCQH